MTRDDADTKPRPIFLALAACAVAAVAAMYVWRVAGERADAARLAWEDAVTARQLAAEIGEAPPTPAASAPAASVPAAVAAAVEAAGLRPEQHASLAAGRDRAKLDLRGVTLDELLAFRDALADASPATVVETLRLQPGDDGDTGTLWDAELTLKP